MSSVCLGERHKGRAQLDGEQLQLGREGWLSSEAQRFLEAAIENPRIGADRALCIVLHRGLGLPLATVGRLTGRTKNVVAKSVATGLQRMAAAPAWRDAPDRSIHRITTVDELAEHSLQHCGDLQPSTVAFYKMAAIRLMRLFEGRRLVEFTEDDARAFCSALAAEGLAQRTVNQLTYAARSMFRLAVRAGLITSNPFPIKGRPNGSLPNVGAVAAMSA